MRPNRKEPESALFWFQSLKFARMVASHTFALLRSFGCRPHGGLLKKDRQKPALLFLPEFYRIKQLP